MELVMDSLAMLEFVLAMAAWIVALRGCEASDRLEALLAGLLLNSAALVLWNAGGGPVAALAAWLLHALVFSAGMALLYLGITLMRTPPLTLRRFLAPVSYIALTLGLSLLPQPGRADSGTEGATVAEETPLPTIPLPAGSAPLPEPAAGEAVQLNAIIVTGELLDRTAERTTTSVGVKTGAEIERSTARDVYDVIRETPNASWHDSELGLSTITLRGIGSYGASQVGSGTIYGTATAIVLDGVALPRAAMGFADLSAFDLEQVEIFRGPQSTSQGRNAMAGAVIINTLAPEVEGSFIPEFRGRLGIGGDRSWQGAAAFGATLWPDRLAVRVVTDHRSSDGDLDNITLGEHDWARDIGHGTRLRAKFTPFGSDGAYEAMLGLGDIRRKTGSRYIEQARETERVATADEASGVVNESQLYSLDQRLRIGEDWTLRAVSAWARSDVLLRFDVDYSAEPEGYIGQQANSHAYSQELRASFESDAWRGTLGLYYFRGLDDETSYGLVSLQALLAAAGLCPLEPACVLPLGNVLVDGDAPARIENRALFGETDWQATERLTLTAGLRLDRERNSRRVVSNLSGDTPGAQAAVALLQAAGAVGANGETRVGRSFSAVLPKISASYELFDGAFAGAAYAEGYRPGGDGYNYGSGRRYSFDAERTRNYELSFKGRLSRWQTQYALNLFHIDWTDMQVPVGTTFDSYIDNAGRSRIRGGELELRTAPSDRLRVIGGLGVTHGRFVDFAGTQGDFSGNPLPKAPGYSATLALEWAPLENLLVRPEVQRVGSSPAQADDGPTHQLPAYSLLNLSLRWQLAGLGLYFNGSNLTDRNYRQDANTAGLHGTEVAALGHGRLLLGGLEFQF